MIPVHCVNPECSSRFSDTYVVESLNAPCPACGMRNTLLQVNVVHLTIPDPRGPMVSRLTGRRFQFACENSRQGFLHGIRHGNYPVFYSTERRAVTCYDCLKADNAALTVGDLLGA